MFTIVIDKRNTPDCIERLSKELGKNPFLLLELQSVSESSIVEAATGNEVYPVWALEFESPLPDFYVREALKIAGFVQERYHENTFCI